MKRTDIRQMLFAVTLLFHIDFVSTQIFPYTDHEDDDYFRAYDKRTYTDNTRSRFRRSVSTASVQPNISSHHKFHMDSYNVAFVFWKHAETQVIFILTCQTANTTNYNKHSNKGCMSKSNFYRSEDHGVKFVKMLNGGIGGAHLHSIYLSPINKQFIILTDYKNKTLYLTNDEGKTFKPVKVPFKPTYIYFHPVLENYIAAYDSTPEGDSSLYMSENKGEKWVKVTTKVRNYFWGRQKYNEKTDLFVERSGRTGHAEGSILLRYSRPYSNSTRIYTETLVPHSVFVGQKYILVQQKTTRKLYVLAGSTREFREVSFNRKVAREVMFVVVSDVDNEIVLALVHPKSEASLYLSDSTGQRFRLMLSGIATDVYKSSVVPPKMDLYPVKGVLGTYIVNRRREGSRITFDKGHTWTTITIPNKHAKTGKKLNSQCKSQQGTRCELVLYLKMEKLYSDFTAPAISKASAPGIIIAQAEPGKFMSALEPMKHIVVISKDGGYTWSHTLASSNGYVILDHGGLIAATPLKSTASGKGKNGALVEYSFNYGKSWSSVPLTAKKARIAAIITESTARLMVMNVFGFLSHDKKSSENGNMWIVWHFNFSKITSAPCKEGDYSTWYQGYDKGKLSCLLGQQVSSRRRKESTLCINGPTFDNRLKRVPCKCTYQDYYCDTNYVRSESGKCVPVNPKYVPPCTEGKYYNRTRGYLKHYGDKCSGGIEEKVKPKQVKCVYPAASMKFTASSTLIAVGEIVDFKIISLLGVYNATFYWTFPRDAYNGRYDEMKKVHYKFTKAGFFNITLQAKWAGVRTLVRWTRVQVLDTVSVEPRIVYARPLLLNKPANFTLRTWTEDGSSQIMQKPSNTKVLWSFDGVYAPKDDLVTLLYTFQKPGPVNVEVQIISSVSTLTPLREQLTVYKSAVHVDLTFSKELDKLNTGTETWIINFEGNYQRYLDTRFNLRSRQLSDRVFVRGKVGKPTRLTIIVCDTVATANTPNESASNIAKNIAAVLEKEKPIVKNFEELNVHVKHARIVGDQTSMPEGEHTWVYILLVIVVMAAVMSLMAYYRYRRKGTLFCLYPHDNMNKQLVNDDDEDETDVGDADPNIVYRDI